jgi:hypothetical protein
LEENEAAVLADADFTSAIYDRTRKSIGTIVSAANLYRNSPVKKPARPASPPLSADTLSQMDRSVDPLNTQTAPHVQSSITITPIPNTSTQADQTKIEAEGCADSNLGELTSTSISPIKLEQEEPIVSKSLRKSKKSVDFILSESQNNKSFSEKSHLAEETEIAAAAVEIVPAVKPKEPKPENYNFETENDSDYLDQLNLRKTIRLTAFDANESVDSHRAEPNKPILRLSQCVFVAPSVLANQSHDESFTEPMDEDDFVEYDDKANIFGKPHVATVIEPSTSKSPRKSHAPRRSVQDELQAQASESEIKNKSEIVAKIGESKLTPPVLLPTLHEPVTSSSSKSVEFSATERLDEIPNTVCLAEPAVRKSIEKIQITTADQPTTSKASMRELRSNKEESAAFNVKQEKTERYEDDFPIE